MSVSVTPNKDFSGAFLHRAIKKTPLLNSLYAALKSRFAPLYKKNPLIIYQMGKVGSETVERSLAVHDLQRPIFRVHSLVEEHINAGLSGAGVSFENYRHRSRHAEHGLYLAKEVARGLQRGHWQVITMVRDPVAQNVSSFFQLIDLFIPNFAAGELSAADLMEVFLKHYPADSNFINWFDVEMKPSFGIDVFASEFPSQAGYKIYREPHVELLLMRLEDVDRCAPAAFQEFLKIDDFQIVKQNEAKEKKYYQLYKQFKDEAVFPSHYVDAVYGSKYARHFYSEAELAAFRQRLKIGE